MLRTVKKITGFKIQAMDGEIGKVDDFFFDDQTWTIRYMVADTGNWLIENLVLISPACLQKPDWGEKLFPVSLTKEQVENSPSILTDQPISRQHEIELHHYYDWPAYWHYGSAFPLRPTHLAIEAEAERTRSEEDTDSDQNDPHLRSISEVASYTIEAADGGIGRVSDFIIDDETWMIRYLVVDTGTFLSGRKVLLAPDWIEAVSWRQKHVQVNLTQETIKNSPVFDPSKLISRTYEEQLYDYYGWLKYWRDAKSDIRTTYFAKDMYGRLIYDINTGQHLAEVKDLLVNPVTYHISALITHKGGVLKSTLQGILSRRVSVWGQDAIFVDGSDVISDLDTLRTQEGWLSTADDLKQQQVVNKDGIRIGDLDDIIIDTKGRLAAYELTKVADDGPLAGQKMIAINTTEALGPDVLVVDL